MRKTLFLTAVLSAASLTFAAPVSAQIGRFDPGLHALAQSPGYTEIGFRHGGWHHHGFHNRWRHGYGRGYGRGFGGYHRHYHGAGVAGLAAGAIIGGALASQAAPAYAGYAGNAVEYCSRKFRSYDPSSGTYLGYDGDRHPCP